MVDVNPADKQAVGRPAITGLEYNGTNLNTLFAQRRNLVNLPFLKMIREILRFNKESKEDLAAGTINDSETLGNYLNRNGYSRFFRNYYIVPMGAAIWSVPELVLEQFPIRFFLQFFNNHGMLSVDDRPTWRVISDGSVTYVRKMMETLGPHTHLNRPVTGVQRFEDHVLVTANQETRRFDQVIFACHSDQTLSMNILQNFHDAPETFCVTLNRSHFCGAYWFDGFHEDGVRSALRVTEALGVELC